MNYDGRPKSASYSEIIDYNLKKAQNRAETIKNYDRTYKQEIYQKGTEWALAKKDLSEAGELQNNKSFLNGYARGLRLLKIEMESVTEPKRR